MIAKLIDSKNFKLCNISVCMHFNLYILLHLIRMNTMVQNSRMNQPDNYLLEKEKHVATVHDWESYKVKDVVDDGTMSFFW